MWLFTDRGYYSVVESGEDAALLVVRARVHKDLVGLKPLIPALDIVNTATRDYPYRAIVTRREWAQALERLVVELDYTNFKDSVTAKQGKRRHDIYLRVWSTLLALTPQRVRHRQLRAFDTLWLDDDRYARRR